MLQSSHLHRAFSRAGLAGVSGFKFHMNFLLLSMRAEDAPVVDRLAGALNRLPG